MASGQITFYHYNGRPLSSFHLGEFSYSFTSVVRSEIHFYHFCTRGAPAQLATSAPSARRVQNDLACPCPPRLSYPGRSQLTQPAHLPCPLHLPRALLWTSPSPPSTAAFHIPSRRSRQLRKGGKRYVPSGPTLSFPVLGLHIYDSRLGLGFLRMMMDLLFFLGQYM